ncbi:MAG: glucose-6-phosphate dehydrogenase, partial [Pseudomonadota bacterium]
SARQALAADAFQAFVREALETFVPDAHLDEAAWDRFRARLTYCALDAQKPEDYASLAEALACGPDADKVFFLATKPGLYGDICGQLSAAGLIGPRARVVLEKPIGVDLASSRQINAAVGRAFNERQIFRIDHYLGKETVQNLIALRFANALFEPLWNARGIDHVQITVSETVGVEGRWSYYNESGALRDMVQNHILQLLCLVAMEPPASLDPDAMRDEKVKVLRSLAPITTATARDCVVRGQYGEGVSGGASAAGYAEEAGGEESATETFVALRAGIENWRWAGVPFYLRTGKRMPERRTEIIIQFKDVPHSIFSGLAARDVAANKLVIRLQPQEDISLLLMNKKPGISGNGMRLQPLALNLSLTDAFQKQRPRRRIAYERLFLDIINNDPTQFVRRDEVEAAWAWIDGISAAWADADDAPEPYAAGSWGPAASVRLTERSGHTWHA